MRRSESGGRWALLGGEMVPSALSIPVAAKPPHPPFGHLLPRGGGEGTERRSPLVRPFGQRRQLNMPTQRKQLPRGGGEGTERRSPIFRPIGQRRQLNMPTQRKQFPRIRGEGTGGWSAGGLVGADCGGNTGSGLWLDRGTGHHGEFGECQVERMRDASTTRHTADEACFQSGLSADVTGSVSAAAGLDRASASSVC